MNKEDLSKLYEALTNGGSTDLAVGAHEYFMGSIADQGEDSRSYPPSVPSELVFMFPEGAALMIPLAEGRATRLPPYITSVRIVHSGQMALELKVKSDTTVVNGVVYHLPKITMESQLTRINIKDQLLMGELLTAALKQMEPARRRPHHTTTMPPYELLYVLADLL